MSESNPVASDHQQPQVSPSRGAPRKKRERSTGGSADAGAAGLAAGLEGGSDELDAVKGEVYEIAAWRASRRALTGSVAHLTVRPLDEPVAEEMLKVLGAPELAEHRARYAAGVRVRRSRRLSLVSTGDVEDVVTSPAAEVGDVVGDVPVDVVGDVDRVPLRYREEEPAPDPVPDLAPDPAPSSTPSSDPTSTGSTGSTGSTIEKGQDQ